MTNDHKTILSPCMSFPLSFPEGSATWSEKCTHCGQGNRARKIGKSNECVSRPYAGDYRQNTQPYPNRESHPVPYLKLFCISSGFDEGLADGWDQHCVDY